MADRIKIEPRGGDNLKQIVDAMRAMVAAQAKAGAEFAAIGKGIAGLSAVAGGAGGAAGGPALAGVQAAADGLRKAAMLPASALSALAGVASNVLGIFDQLTSTFGRFVQASNPALMERYQMVVKDLTAAFGRIFEPVIEAGVQFANVLNQFVTSLQPVLGPLVRQLADAFLQIAKAVLDAVAPVVEALIPVFQMLADVVLPPIVTVFRVLADAIRSVINWVRSWLGLSPLSRASDRGGPRTAAANRATLIGTEQIGEQARAASFGASSTVDMLRQNNSLTASSNELLRNIGRAIDRMAAGRGGVAAVADASIAAINGMAGRAGR